MQRTQKATRGSCDNFGGYYEESASSTSVPTTTTAAHSYPYSTSTSAPSTTHFCYTNSYHCSGHRYYGQCYTGVSSDISCSTCNNIGGDYDDKFGCFYYSNNCEYLSAGKQCHTNRCVIAMTYNFSKCSAVRPVYVNIFPSSHQPIILLHRMTGYRYHTVLCLSINLSVSQSLCLPVCNDVHCGAQDRRRR